MGHSVVTSDGAVGLTLSWAVSMMDGYKGLLRPLVFPSKQKTKGIVSNSIFPHDLSSLLLSKMTDMEE